MRVIIRGILCCSLIIFSCYSVIAQPLSFIVEDKESLQRGARLFMNYCSGCHSLKYLRYSQMAEGLGLTRFNNQINHEILKNNLIFTQATLEDPIRIALPPEDAKEWFGVVPPDLSLIAKEKGTKWLYNYLSSFYKDDTRPFGTNNLLVPDVAMPNILETLNNDLAHSQFDSNLQDIVSFLFYVSEPDRLIRFRLGIFVIGFLVVLFFFSLGLKAVYWRKINTK